MARCIAQVSLKRNGGLPEDDVVNTWHFESDNGFSTDAPGLLTRLSDFYQALATMWSATLDGNGEIKLYDYDDELPRVPQSTGTFNFGRLADTMPTEVCICLSMAAAVQSGQSKGRRRGRVYLGPLGRNVSVMVAGASDGRPGQTERTAILQAAEDMATGGPGAFRLAVYSPTTKLTGGTDDEAWNDVETLWVDNAFDIQRRRGARATARDTITISG